MRELLEVAVRELVAERMENLGRDSMFANCLPLGPAYATGESDELCAAPAEAETGHAFGHLDFLKEVGDPATGEPMGKTELNLKASAAGETYEYTQMYPGMAKTAREEGYAELAEWFETLAKAEKSHAGRFQKALDELPK